MGQKADIVLVFQSVAPTSSPSTTPRTGLLVGTGAEDQVPGRGHTEDGGLDIERVGRDVDPRVAEAMDAAVELVSSSDGLGTNALTQALKELGFGGSTVD
jgi:hypothetical protein